MTRIRKVYLPKWASWLGVIFLVPMWVWISFRVFATPRGAEDLGLLGWAIMTLVVLGAAVMLLLMGQRKLPTYVIVEEEEEEEEDGDE